MHLIIIILDGLNIWNSRQESRVIWVSRLKGKGGGVSFEG